LAQQKNVEDFEAIFHQYKGWVYKTAYLIVQDKHKAETMQHSVINSMR